VNHPPPSITPIQNVQKNEKNPDERCAQANIKTALLALLNMLICRAHNQLFLFNYPCYNTRI
jgi:hypothetical protein